MLLGNCHSYENNRNVNRNSCNLYYILNFDRHEWVKSISNFQAFLTEVLLKVGSFITKRYHLRSNHTQKLELMY